MKHAASLMMIATVMSIVVCAASAGAEEAELASFSVSTLAEVNVEDSLAQEGVVTFDPTTTSDGDGALKIVHSGAGPKSVSLFRVPLEGVEDTVLWYKAAVRAQGATGKAYLELWCEFPGGNRYFSRALDQSLTGTTGWRHSQTPFFLKEGHQPRAVLLGVRFEGPGAVWIDDVRLVKGSSSWLGQFNLEDNPGAVLGVLGGILGAMVGIWGGIAGTLASKGRARAFVLTSAWVIILLGAALAGIGGYCYFTRQPYGVWFPMVLAGGIIALVVLANYPALARRYTLLEASRLEAMDRSDNL